MGCDCAKVERTPLWSSIPEYRQPTEIQPGENIDCYASRSGSPSGLKNDIGSQPPNQIKNTSFTSSLSAVVNTTFQLTPTSTPVGAVTWQFVIDGTNRTNTLFMGITWSSTGVLSGTIDDAFINTAYQVLVSASDTNGALDSRTFTFYPKKDAPKGETIKFVKPLIGGSPARITCAFGPRTPPAPGASSMHNGIDMALTDHSQGTIVSAADGVVVKAGPATGFGNWVVIEHYDAQERLVATTVYGHMKTIFVTVGDKVAAGQKIALEGNEGIGSGMHLHFEMHKGKWRAPTDPVPYFDGTTDVAVDNDPNTISEDGVATPTGYETVSVSNSGMTTGEANANDGCPGETAESGALAEPDPDQQRTYADGAPTITGTSPAQDDVLALIDAELNGPHGAGLTTDDKNFIRTVALIESNLNPTAKNPTSSALGLYQFLDALAIKYYGIIGQSPTYANRTDASIATHAMIEFYNAEIKPYWTGFVSSGKTKIANKPINATDWSGASAPFYSGFSQGDFMYGLVHHDGVGNAVKGKDLGGVAYWRKKSV